jgi:hypothetical protein
MNSCQRARDSPRANSFGSNVGRLTIARMPPVFGSIATAAPRPTCAIAVSSACWTSRSSASFRSSPGRGATAGMSESVPDAASRAR